MLDSDNLWSTCIMVVQRSQWTRVNHGVYFVIWSHLTKTWWFWVHIHSCKVVRLQYVRIAVYTRQINNLFPWSLKKTKKTHIWLIEHLICNLKTTIHVFVKCTSVIEHIMYLLTYPSWHPMGSCSQVHILSNWKLSKWGQCSVKIRQNTTSPTLSWTTVCFEIMGHFSPIFLRMK